MPDPGRCHVPSGSEGALALIGKRWTLPVLVSLMLGPRRFGHLKQELNGISANVLTQRLNELEQRGLVERATLPPPASVQVYRATARALRARTALRALA